MESVFGNVNSAIVSKDEVVLMHTSDIQSHLSDLNNIVSNSSNDLVTEFTNKRISMLKSDAVDIVFPILTNTENSFNHDRYDDAFKATLSAIKNGVSVGGGKSYINALKNITEMESHRLCLL
jgi:chaperonin GroEL (HSP60 family)